MCGVLNPVIAGRIVAPVHKRRAGGAVLDRKSLEKLGGWDGNRGRSLGSEAVGRSIQELG